VFLEGPQAAQAQNAEQHGNQRVHLEFRQLYLVYGSR
jgi:hypothetical protein